MFFNTIAWWFRVFWACRLKDAMAYQEGGYR